MAKLIVGIIYSDKELFEEVKKVLEEKFSKIEDSVSYDFNFTKYYEDEMGPNLKKDILIFEQEIKEEQLAEIKSYTNSLEDNYRINNNRKINIDPGYLTKEELILASNKKSNYKAEIGKNIYSHLILRFENSKCVNTTRTYPGYRTEKVQSFLTRIVKKMV
jgi:hypothetical protein